MIKESIIIIIIKMFKIAGLVHQSLVVAAPSYFAEDCPLLYGTLVVANAVQLQ